MKDFAGNELEVGMKVVCLKPGSSNSWMIWAEVVGFTPQKVRLKVSEKRKSIDYGTGKINEYTYEDTFLREPDNVVVPMTEHLKHEIEQDVLFNTR